MIRTPRQTELTRLGWWGAMIASTFYAVRPFRFTDFMPSVDFPAHAALAKALIAQTQSDNPLRHFFKVGFFPSPNSLFYLLTFVTNVFAGDVVLSAKIVVLVGLSLTPWAFAYFVTGLGLSPWLSLAAFPFIVQWPFSDGFLDYVLSIPVTLMALGAAAKSFSYKCRRNVIFWALPWSALAFITHIQGYLYFVCGSALLVALAIVEGTRQRGHRWNHLVRPVLIGTLLNVAGLLCALVWYYGAGNTMASQSAKAFDWDFSIARKLSELPKYTVFVLFGDFDDIWFLRWMVAFTLAWAILRFGRERENCHYKTEGTAFENFPFLFLSLLALGYCVLPDVIGTYTNLYRRIAPFAVFIALACMCGRRRIKITMPALALAAIVLISSTRFAAVQLSWVLYYFNLSTKGLRHTLNAIPKGTTLAYYPERTDLDGFDTFLSRHLGQYHTAINDGTTSFSFAWYKGRLIEQRTLGFDFEFLNPRLLENPTRLRPYQYVFQYGKTPLDKKWPTRFQLFHREDDFRVYINLGYEKH